MTGIFYSLARSFVIIINTLVAFLACLLIYASYTTSNKDFNAESLGEPKLINTYVSIIFASFGLLVAIVASLGLVGGIKQSKTLLAIYATIVFTSILFVLFVIVLTYTSNASNLSITEVDKTFVNSTVVVYNYVNSNDYRTTMIDYIQRTFSCCGVNSPDDWSEYALHKIPKSCCSSPIESQLPVYKYCQESDYKTGCWKAVTDVFFANMPLFRVSLYVAIAFGTICTFVAVFMIKALKLDLDMV